MAVLSESTYLSREEKKSDARLLFLVIMFMLLTFLFTEGWAPTYNVEVLCGYNRSWMFPQCDHVRFQEVNMSINASEAIV